MNSLHSYYADPDPSRLRIAPRVRGRYRYVRLRWRLLFAVIDAVGWCLWGPARLARRLFGSTFPAPRRVLVVQLDHFGDAVMSLGMLAALRGRFPDAKIDVLCSPWNRELFSVAPDVDAVHVLSASRFAGSRGSQWLKSLFATAWRLRRERYDLAIDVRGEFPHTLLMWLAGTRRRMGWNCGGGGFLLTDSAAFVAGRHEVLSRGALLAKLGIDVACCEYAPRFEPTAAELQWAKAQLAHAVNDGPLVALHVGSRMQAKRWPMESWLELAGRLICSHDARVVLLGGRDDGRAGDPLSALPGVVDLRGGTTIPQLAAVLRRCDLLIGGDSGPAHLAAAVGTPVVALFSGNNDADQWRPWGDAVTVVRRQPACSPCHCETCPWSDHPCMRGITPAEVLQRVEPLIARGSVAENADAHQPHFDPAMRVRG